MKTLFNTADIVSDAGLNNPNASGIAIDALPPLLRMLLSTDGTVTKSLEAYFWEPVQVENLGQAPLILKQPVAALELHSGDPVVQRRVRLCGRDSGRVYAYAESMLRLQFLPEPLRADILAGKIGIGELLRERGLETYREVLELGRRAAVAPDIFPPMHTELVYRTYRIWIAGAPTILITEVFPVALYREAVA